MLKIDSHHHLWEFNAREYSWIDEHMTVLRRDFLPADLHEEMRAAGVSGAVAVQARQTVEETRRLLEFAGENQSMFGVVGWAPLIDSNVASVIEEFAAQPKLRGFRHVLQDEADENYILREDFGRGVRELTRHDLTYDILIFERHLPQTIRFVDRHPNQRFVVDHLAKPRVREKRMSPWRERMHELAKRENVYCKISGLATEADHAHWTEEELRPYIDTVLEAFGPKRLLFGSDWPVCLLAVSYARWIEIVSNAIGTLSPAEQRRVWAETAIECYRLNGSFS